MFGKHFIPIRVMLDQEACPRNSGHEAVLGVLYNIALYHSAVEFFILDNSSKQVLFQYIVSMVTTYKVPCVIANIVNFSGRRHLVKCNYKHIKSIQYDVLN